MAQPAGRVAGVAVVELDGGEALAGGLRRAQRDARKAMRGSNRKVARQVRDWSRAAAQSGTRLQARMAGAIGSRANVDNAQLTVRATAGAPGGPVAFWGAKKRTGWYGRRRYADSPTPQHPEWIGNRWQVGVRGQGPYVLNEVLAQRLPEIADAYLEGQWEALDRAIPGRLARL